MNPLSIDEIVDRDRYAGLRSDYRSAVIAYKRTRRVAVGENITLVFENRETIRFQVQEMLWVEGTRAPNKIQHELDTYNELIPAHHGLSATLFVDITDGESIRPTLNRLVGIDEHVSLVIGENHVVNARFDPKQMEEDRLSAVQYIQFHLDPEQHAAFCDPAQTAWLRIDHPNYEREVELGPETRASLISDLSGEPEGLMPDFDSVEPPSDLVLFETGGVRAVRPARPLAPGHVIVEPLDYRGSIVDASAELLAEMMLAVQRAARDIVSEFGSCRIQADLADESGAFRWHLYPAPG